MTAINPHLPLHGMCAYDALPGVVPFARTLQAANRVRRVEPIDRFEPSAPARDPALPDTTPPAALLPRLGEILPVKPLPEARVMISEQRQLSIPATGRVLDLYA